MFFHSDCRSSFSGSSQVTLSCHGFFINNLARMTTGTMNPNGSKILVGPVELPFLWLDCHRLKWRTLPPAKSCLWLDSSRGLGCWLRSYHWMYFPRSNGLKLCIIGEPTSESEICTGHDGPCFLIVLYSLLFCVTTWNNIVHVKVGLHVMWHSWGVLP